MYLAKGLVTPKVAAVITIVACPNKMVLLSFIDYNMTQKVPIRAFGRMI